MHLNQTQNQTHSHYFSFTWDYLSITCVTLATTNIFLHCFGIWLLFKSKCKIKEHVEILSLSFNIICFCVFSIMNVILLIELPAFNPIPLMFIHANLVPFYAGMILLTLQRFFAIWLHLRYESSWVFLKRTHMVVVAWLVGAVYLVLGILYSTSMIKYGWLHYLFLNTPNAGLVSTNAVFIFTYTYIYVKYRRATQATKNSLYRNRKSKFFTPVIICASFVVFGTIPHFLFHLHGDLRLSFLWFLLDGISNFFVYIFTNEKVTRLLKQKAQKRPKNRSTCTSSTQIPNFDSNCNSHGTSGIQLSSLGP